MGSPAGAQHRAAHGVEKLVDDEHGVERQAPLGQPARSAHVDKHDDHVTLDPRRDCSGPIGVDRRRVGGEHGHKRDVAGWTKLAGEPDPWGRVHPFEHRLLGGARNREARDVAKDADAASRAAAAAAAHMRVRNAVDEARFQHAEAPRYANRAVGIGQPDRADPVLSPLSEGAGGERGGERHSQEGERPRALVQKDRVLSRGPDVLGREIARQPCRVLNRH